MDDILVSAATQKQHDDRLEQVVKIIQKAGITLNEKCEFSKPSVTFLGHVIDGEGCRPDPKKVQAITEMETPKNVSEVRRFLGMVNQLSKFSPNIAEKSMSLRELLNSKNAWTWGPSQEKSFSDIKSEMTNSLCLIHFDVNKETVISADASSYGLGAVLRQYDKGFLKPVAYASRSMSETEQRYAQIEKEALAITWACEKFSNYLIGSKFKIQTDHKPLVPLLSTKDLAELPIRVQRFKLRLMRYNFTISHIPGKDLITADALSRSPCGSPSISDEQFEDETRAYVDTVVSDLPATTDRLSQIKAAYIGDAVCENLIKFCQDGWPEKSRLGEVMKSYWSYMGEMTFANGLLLMGSRLVIPTSMQGQILDKIHDGHQGIVKGCERA